MKKTYLAIAMAFVLTSAVSFAQAPTTPAPGTGQQQGQRKGKKLGSQDGAGPQHEPGTGGGTGTGNRNGRK